MRRGDPTSTRSAFVTRLLDWQQSALGGGGIAVIADRWMGSRFGLEGACRLAPPMLVVVLQLSGSLPARADWEYARWGMSVAEVIAASRGRATKTTPLEQGPSLVSTGYFLARAQYAAAGTQFEVSFYFKDGKLSAVALSPQATSVLPKLRQELLRELGEPRTKGSKQYGMGMAEEEVWRDPKHGNTIMFRVVDFGSDSERIGTLVYSPTELQPKPQR